MSSKLRMKVFIITLIVGIVFILSPFTVKADDSAEPVLEVGSSAGLDDLCTEVNKLSQKYGSFDFIKHSTTGGGVHKISLNMTDYRSDALTSDERSEIMRTALNAVNKSSNLTGQAKTRIYNFISNQDEATSSLVRQLSEDVKSDFANAYSWFKPFTGFLSTFFGFISMAIFAMLGIMIIVDLSYLTIPFIRYWLDCSAVDETGKKADKPRLVSHEAWIAVQESEKVENSGKSSLGIYMKKKVWQLCVVAICLLYLVSGKLYNLIGWFIDAFRGVLG